MAFLSCYGRNQDIPDTLKDDYDNLTIWGL